MAGEVCAFWSYTRDDDECEDGRISRLRVDLERRLGQMTGNREFRIFQDRKDIGWGKPWQEVIRSGLADSIVLFPIITPLFFSSDACLEELEWFHQQEKERGRNDLILPLYYLDSDLVDDKTVLAAADERVRRAVALIHERNYEDWRPLRHEMETDPSFRRAVEGLAKRAKPLFPPPGKAAPAATGGPAPVAKESQPVTTPVADRPHLIHTVDVDPLPGRGQYHRINDAIVKEPPGTRIRLHPGRYHEDVLINKPVEIVGVGPREEIIILSDQGNALIIDVNMAQVRGISIRQRGTPFYAVSIKQGRAEIDDCDVSSTGLTAVGISGTADPTLRRNRIHHSGEAGIVIYDRARGTIEDNEISANTLSGVGINGQADPILRRNRIFENKQSGVTVYENGRGTIEENEISGNGFSGVAIKEQADPTLRRNRIFDNKQGGVFFHENGRGTVEENEISANGMSGVSTKTGGDPLVRNNRINNNGYEAIWIYEQGQGRFIRNDLTGNKHGPYDIAEDCKAKVTLEDNKV